MHPKRTALILTAAGSSTRFALGKKKEYQALRSILFPEQKAGTVLSCCAEAFFYAFNECSDFIFSRFIITVPAGTRESAKARKALNASPFVVSLLEKLPIEAEFIEGGADRRESVCRALEHIAKNSDKPDLVLIHDAARPFVSVDVIKRVLSLCAEKGAAAPVLPPIDTHKETDPVQMRVVRHIERSRLAAVQTPQGFYFGPLLEAHRKTHNDGKTYTDDTEIWGAYAGDVYVCEGSRANIKVTYQEDLKKNAYRGSAHTSHNDCVFRTGLGFDMHRLAENRPLLIGGVHIPFEKGELGHSDGDVLLHAVTDALLGAAALGDIGELFPPTDDKWKNADSAVLLKSAWSLVEKAGWQLENIDCVVVIERPKMLPWREKIRERIASVLNCEPERIFIKAKTAEGLGDIGEGKAVSAQCTCLLRFGGL